MAQRIRFKLCWVRIYVDRFALSRGLSRLVGRYHRGGDEGAVSWRLTFIVRQR